MIEEKRIQKYPLETNLILVAVKKIYIVITFYSFKIYIYFLILYMNQIYHGE